jgi:hypothetical protein
VKVLTCGRMLLRIELSGGARLCVCVGDVSGQILAFSFCCRFLMLRRDLPMHPVIFMVRHYEHYECLFSAVEKTPFTVI